MKMTPAILLAASIALAAGAEPALTIYNQNFAVVRDTVPLDLQAGANPVTYSGATAQVEPDSVILRDPNGNRSLQILEQNYRNDPVSEPLLLSLFEGKTIDFQNKRMKDNTETYEPIQGKIVRSGYVPGGEAQSPIIEVNGKLQFSLPGEPLFPDLGDDTVLKPAFNWLLQSDKPGKFDAEVGYITEGFEWSASYNLVSPETGDYCDLVGWITMNNNSGKTFENAKIKLMAGDVNKIQAMPLPQRFFRAKGAMAMDMAGEAPAVTEKAFDEFHLYSIARPTTLHDHETKQVEFVHAEKMYAPTIYVYDGASGYQFYGLNYDQSWGQSDNKKVLVQREFVNDETNQLGIALPAGKLRFYRRDADGQLQFVGENTIDHTPRKETVRVTTGNSFDLVGERKQTDFHVDTGDKHMDESFEIKLRNRKKEPVEIRVVEHLYRWSNWEITKKSDDFVKKDSQTIEFKIPVKPDEEKTVAYTVHYSW
ncbi:MAG TPA: DUF4139 domain-containing protein [Candidatus Sulfotelmatobacter sp.]|jgi:hypothetical protein|nr:DUF4139 domain-containing protein [Candidatus Sulfotelmatobacter sp.]